MLGLLCTTWLAAAAPLPVVAVGDGPVVAPLNNTAPDQTVPGGWVTVLADCLEERQPARFTVVDRVVLGETTATFKERLEPVRELRPSWVVVALGARELAQEGSQPAAIRAELETIVTQLRAKTRKIRPEVLLIGPVSPALEPGEGRPGEGRPGEGRPGEGRPGEGKEGDEGSEQASLDARIGAYNAQLTELAASIEGVTFVDLWSGWPREPSRRSGLTVGGWTLSDQGHARVAAAVCDAVLAE
ncbi:MAG TPA: SGNH/GDSL hydrolase family protein [Deltaproteobacteria bacterium]|nr:SGNH/GDSL hydrolase family protein [Deltaproteobacteria bacterium]